MVPLYSDRLTETLPAFHNLGFICLTIRVCENSHSLILSKLCTQVSNVWFVSFLVSSQRKTDVTEEEEEGDDETDVNTVS